MTMINLHVLNRGPQLYNRKLIPTGQFKGTDADGQAIIELEYPELAPDQPK